MRQDVTTRIDIEVKGTPRARPRPRHRVMRTRQGKLISSTYQPKPSRNTGRKLKPDEKAWLLANIWYDAVKQAILAHLPATPWVGGVFLDVDVYFERPKYMLKKKYPDGRIRHTGKPDRDNLDKSILDALKEAGLFIDDGQVCDGAVRKWYAHKGCGPGVRIVTYRIPLEGDRPFLSPPNV